MSNDKSKTPDREDRHEYIPGAQEKATLGGAFNSGVTSDDPAEKEEIEKKGSLANIKPKADPNQSDAESNG